MFSFSCSNEGPTQVTSKDVFIWRGARLSPTLNFSHFPKWEVNNNKSLLNAPKTLNSLECDQIITSSFNISLIKSSTQSLNEAQPTQVTSKDVFIWRGARLSPTLNFSHFPKWEVNNNKSLPNTPKTLNSLECDQIITISSNVSLIKSSTQSLNEAQPSQLVHVHDLLKWVSLSFFAFCQLTLFLLAASCPSDQEFRYCDATCPQTCGDLKNKQACQK